MADILLADLSGQTFLVRGEELIDDLLANTLPPEISIEFVTCESESEVIALWVRNGGDTDGVDMPWAIHPNISRRIRRTTSGDCVYFQPWSAMLDEEAKAVIKSAAGWAQEFAERDVTLISHVDPAGPRAMADLANLRISLIEEELTGHGVAAGRIRREQRPLLPGAVGEEAQRIDIVIKGED